ncbi:MAG: diguanylate cyclase [Tissierellia bacterium]|nr:diguanylate cyclase [Tissierellia bacterium]
MEYPSINDFYLKLKSIYNKDGNFIDYVLIYISENFSKATKINTNLIMGEKLSDIVIENDNILGLKEFYFNMLPKTKGKHEIYIENLDRWYIINIFNDKEENLVIFYCDISEIRKNLIASNNMSHLIGVSCYRDNLTNLYNRGFLEEELKRLDTKRQLPITVIMGDINGLKLINDAFGHGMGDRVLKNAAEIMKSHFRKEDIVSRIGGDEFMILLPKTSEEIGLSIVNRLKRFCENNPIDIIKMSISFGVATKEKFDEDIKKIVKKAEEKIYFSKLKESKEAKQEMIAFLKNRLETITFETKAHYERLKELSLMLADEVGISEMEKEELRLLCEFHDIGKIGIPKKILQKEGILNNEEWEDIKRHSEIGYNIVKEFRDTLPIDELILVHHERWDGKGYPGLYKDKQIPIVVRIFAIADAYEAMVNDRPYKERISHKQALKEILDKAGSQFDPNLANLFVKLMDKEEQIG